MEHSTTAQHGQTGRAASLLADEAAQGGWSPVCIGMDLSAPFGVYADGHQVAEFASEPEAEAFYQRLRTARH